MNKPILFFKQGIQYLTTAYCTGNVGETTITIVTNPDRSLTVGMYVSGVGIASGATIVSFPTSSTIELSSANTGAVDGTLTFTTPGAANPSSQVGPWIVYDRIGDRDIITQSMVAQLYLQPVNVPAVIRGKFSEVGQYYEFLPYAAEGDLINMYYYKAWPLLFSPADDQLVDMLATISSSTGTSATLTLNDTSSLTVGDTLISTAGTGTFNGQVTVSSIDSSTQVTISGTGIVDGDVTDVYITNITVQNNAVLATWPEGYVYGTLREYYIKRHNKEDAAIYDGKFTGAMDTVEDQNNLGKWSGGHTRLTSVWQPRQYRQYNIK